jgi:hypothetical protein
MIHLCGNIPIIAALKKLSLRRSGRRVVFMPAAPGIQYSYASLLIKR